MDALDAIGIHIHRGVEPMIHYTSVTFRFAKSILEEAVYQRLDSDQRQDRYKMASDSVQELEKQCTFANMDFGWHLEKIILHAERLKYAVARNSNALMYMNEMNEWTEQVIGAYGEEHDIDIDKIDEQVTRELMEGELAKMRFNYAFDYVS